MISWIVNIGGLCLFYYFTDLTPQSVFASVICPILVTLFLISTAVKIALSTSGYSGGRYSSDGGGGFYGGDGGCGGDGGGGDC
ncbi:hypothetical protein EUZ85_16950 [Hahella sp. KA22]|uniref:hypothetical protein n=1 Tax=Hahella sp. KA22 TaxID=1628392 RepID=UPI000FDE52B0|nr:hypothetical protein [Hahella sp. KA22]AZZ92323.1 hypothetical protein ENC22_14380 [Hahella sp. KA22]QAY55695.1 hypothetical protein EUZ85_16950 [Hahella sp. KA22]